MEMNFTRYACVPVVSKRLSRDVANPFQLLLGGQQVRVGFSAGRTVLPGEKDQVDQRLEWIIDLVGDRRGHTARGRKLFCLNYQAFHPLPIRHISGDLRGPNHSTGLVPDRRNRHRHAKSLAALLNSDGVVMIDSAPGSELSEDLVFLILEFLRNEPQNRLSYHLLRGVTEHPECSFVPSLDDTVQILADDGVLRGIDNRCQPESAVIILGAVGHVVCDFRRAENLACFVPNRRDRDGDWKSFTILLYAD